MAVLVPSPISTHSYQSPAVCSRLHSRLGQDRVRVMEEQVEAAATGKGSAAVGDAADSVAASLVVLPAEAIHEKHVDGNLLAEFVSCPVLLLP